jgi:GT2 family glycosyltransferase
LAECLTRLAPGTQTLDAKLYELIVSDDGSKSTSEKLVHEQFPWAKWFPGPKTGPADNRTLGASHAQGEWLVFIDDDTVPEPTVLEEYYKGIVANPDAVGLEGAIHAIGDVQSDMLDCPINTTGGNFWTANVGIRRDVFEELHGFQSDHPLDWGEDMDMNHRLNARGKVVFLPEAVVSHPIRILTVPEAFERWTLKWLAWALYGRKNRETLGLKDNKDVMRTSVRVMFYTCAASLKKGKIRQAAIYTTILFVKMPYIWKSIKTVPEQYTEINKPNIKQPA